MNKIKKVLITRPEGQAQELAKLLESQGFEAVILSTIEIQPIAFDHLPTAEWLIFTSVHAVEASYSQILSGQKIAAIGPATAAALAERGHRAAVVPEQANSEGLLACQPFTQARGLTIAIIKGVGGRSVLSDTLTQQGAQLETLDVYQRVCPSQCARERPEDIDAVVTSSVESLLNLWELLAPAAKAQLHEAVFVLFSARAAEHLPAGTPYVVVPASNEHIINALQHYSQQA